MIVEFTGRHTTVHTKLKTQANAGLERIARVTNRCTSAHVILTEDKYRKIAEVTVQCRGESIVATCEATEMETALHDALAKVEQQAIRHKQKFETARAQPKPLAA
jgi:putative sigma-54 modulation protein